MTELQVFGSVARGEDTDASDLDLLVQVPEGTGLLALGQFTQELEDLLCMPVDASHRTASSPGSAAPSSGTWCRCESQTPQPAAGHPRGQHRDRRSPHARPLTDGLVDAVRARLIETVEAVKEVSTNLLAQQPTIPWRQVAALRDQLAHRYFDTSHAIVEQTVGPALAERTVAVTALLATLGDPE